MSDLPLFQVAKIANYSDYKNYLMSQQQANIKRLVFEKNILPQTKTDFHVSGHCFVCAKTVDFLIDFKYTQSANPNWRERVVCPSCQLNNRMRATIHIFKQECQPQKQARIYLTEQTTILYRWFKENYSTVYGSEYLAETIAYGSENHKGIRNEDITKLSFETDSFDYILSFDVFEHIPDYKKALAQCLRCLKPNGQLLFSVPFVKNAENNIIRAYIDDNGELIHLLPPEYHGDPINAQGCLCFYHFGWEILKDLSDIGFSNVSALLYSSQDYGYLGGEQIMFSATKA